MVTAVAEVVTAFDPTDPTSLVTYTCDCRECDRIIYLTPEAFERLTNGHLYVQVADCANPLPDGAVYAGFIGNDHRLFRLGDESIPVTPPVPEEEPEPFNLFADGDFDLI